MKKVDDLGPERQIQLPAKSLERGHGSESLAHYSLCQQASPISKAMLELSDRVSETEQSHNHLRWEYSGAAGAHVSKSCNDLHSGSEHFHSCIQKRSRPWWMLYLSKSLVAACWELVYLILAASSGHLNEGIDKSTPSVQNKTSINPSNTLTAFDEKGLLQWKISLFQSSIYYISIAWDCQTSRLVGKKKTQKLETGDQKGDCLTCCIFSW